MADFEDGGDWVNVQTVQLVLSGELRGKVLHAFHDEMGHLGVEQGSTGQERPVMQRTMSEIVECV